jgi:hypothetical protein
MLNLKRNIVSLALSFICCILLCSCFPSKKITKQSHLNELENGEYNLYYLDEKAESLKSVKYSTETTDKVDLINELISKIYVPPEDRTTGIEYPLKDEVRYKESKIDGNTLYVYFDKKFTSMDYDRQILALAAFTKTLTQIEGIDDINFFSEEEALLDSRGEAFGALSGSLFIDSVSDVNFYQKSELNLYFADDSGENLVPEKREVFYDVNTSIDKIIIEELLLGPRTSGLQRTIPANTKFISSSVVDGICYVNFDKEFLTPIQGQKESIAIYSLVNSLTEVPEIKKVQISVDGSKSYLYRDIISLDTFFEREITK